MIPFLACLFIWQVAGAWNHHSLENIPQPVQLPSNVSMVIMDLLAAFSDLDSLGNTTECDAKLTQLVTGLTAKDPESVTFLDALGKPGAGITQGNLVMIGNYDMCGMAPLEKYTNCGVQGRMTLMGAPIPGILLTGCSPPECQTQEDLQGVIEKIVAIINKSGFIITDPTSWTVKCDSQVEWDTGAYAAIVVICLFGAFVVAGTISYAIYPIVLSLRDRGRDDTAGLIQSEIDGIEQTENHETKNQPKSLLECFLNCFALQRTMNTLFSTATKPGQILCLNGIRVLSINWVVLGHTYAYVLSNLGDLAYFKELFNRKSFMVVHNGLPSVDSFFTLSGFLVTFLLLKNLAKQGSFSPLQWLAFYLHRYVRLTAPYLVAILLEGWLYRHFVSGPMAQQKIMGPASTHDMCEKYWFTDFLYINNLYPWKGQAGCLRQGWYLANDMQFFVLAPIFVFLLFKKSLAGIVGTLGAIGASAIATGVITAHYKLGPSMIADLNQNDFWMLYNKPWVRITPYLVGIIGGWLYWKMGEQTERGVKTLPAWLKVMCAVPLWAITITIQYAVVFGLYDTMIAEFTTNKNPSTAVSLGYGMFARIAWGMALTVQIILCQCGLGGFINSLLSWSGWQVLSRLTYSVFLLHLGIFTVLAAQMRHPIYIRPDFEYITFYLGFLVMSYLAAAALYVVVEQPVANLEGITYRRADSKSRT